MMVPSADWWKVPDLAAYSAMLRNGNRLTPTARLMPAAPWRFSIGPKIADDLRADADLSFQQTVLIIPLPSAR
jgi:hypothetical protein